MFACIMLSRIQNMRLQAVECLNRAFAAKQPNLKLVQEKLLLNTPQDALTFLTACGWVCSVNERGIAEKK